jgi:hypothetical protein
MILNTYVEYAQFSACRGPLAEHAPYQLPLPAEPKIIG